jgi:hypothetical protein
MFTAKSAQIHLSLELSGSPNIGNPDKATSLQSLLPAPHDLVDFTVFHTLAVSVSSFGRVAD